MTVMTSPVALLTATALGGVPLGAIMDRMYLRAVDRLECEMIRRRVVRRVRARASLAGPAESTGRAALALTAPDEPADGADVPAAAPVRVQGGHPAAATPESTSLPGDHMTPEAAKRAGNAARRAERAESMAGTIVFVSPHEQVGEFLAHVRATALGRHPETGRCELSLNDKQWIAAYRTWAKAQHYIVVPEELVLAQMGARVKDKTGVEKHRPRLKDPATGAVLRNANGSPLRETRYVVTEYTPPPAATPKAAGKPEKTRAEKIADLEHGPADETWAEMQRRLAA